MFAALADLTASLTTAGAAGPAGSIGPRTALETLLHDAFDETGLPPAWCSRCCAPASADLIQLLDRRRGPRARSAHLAGRLLAPDKPYLATQLDFLQRLTRGRRPRDAGAASPSADVPAGYDTVADPGACRAIAAIADGVGEVDRQAPGRDPAGVDRRTTTRQPCS